MPNSIVIVRMNIEGIVRRVETRTSGLPALTRTPRPQIDTSHQETLRIGRIHRHEQVIIALIVEWVEAVAALDHQRPGLTSVRGSVDGGQLIGPVDMHYIHIIRIGGRYSYSGARIVLRQTASSHGNEAGIVAIGRIKDLSG